MNFSECSDFLESHEIKPTANRLLLLQTLSTAKRPLSQAELEACVGTIDKSNISRSLALFKEHRLLHVLEDGSEGVRYELCLRHDDAHDDDAHVHFFCEVCHKTFCLSDIAIPEVHLPDGYDLHSVNYMAKGICPQCKKHHHTY